MCGEGVPRAYLRLACMFLVVGDHRLGARREDSSSATRPLVVGWLVRNIVRPLVGMLVGFPFRL